MDNYKNFKTFTEQFNNRPIRMLKVNIEKTGGGEALLLINGTDALAAMECPNPGLFLTLILSMHKEAFTDLWVEITENNPYDIEPGIYFTPKGIHKMYDIGKNGLTLGCIN
mgnify:CR=1 FL=1